MSKYLDYDGLSYFKEKLDENLDSKVATIKQAIFSESWVPELETGYGFSGISSYSSTGTLNDGDSVFAIWTDTSTSIVYAGVAEVYSISTELAIEFISLSEVGLTEKTLYRHNIVVWYDYDNTQSRFSFTVFSKISTAFDSFSVLTSNAVGVYTASGADYDTENSYYTIISTYVEITSMSIILHGARVDSAKDFSFTYTSDDADYLTVTDTVEVMTM